MKRTWSLQIILSVIVLLVVSISACSPSRVSVDEFNQVPTAGGEEPGGDQESPPQTEAPGQDEEPQPVATQSREIPEDIPVIEGVTRLQVIRGGTNILFRYNGSIDDVVTFYQDVLPEHGWELAGPPDNVIGAIATMLRENEVMDTLAINMQANELGGFVDVTITVSRVQ